MSDFSQDPPHIGNQYSEDQALQSYLSLLLGKSLSVHEASLRDFGSRVVHELLPHHRNCELYPPRLEQYSAWGERVDKIHTHPSWAHMHRVSAEEQLVRLGYSGLDFSRTLQFAKLYLFNPSSGLYTCPLAMTDGAAYLIRHVLTRDEELDEVFNHLTSQRPEDFWTSGQWMTEKPGGSDVASATQTTAVLVSGDKYKLSGYKWFTSATTAEVAFTLARIDGKVSLFLVRIKENKKNIQVVRLKDKLGTRQLPTAELVLTGCVGKLVSPAGQGIKTISSLMNVTRLYNSVCAVSSMRRAVAIARDYAHRRAAFGRVLASHVLHKETLFNMEVKVRGCLLWVLYLSTLLEKTEKNSAEEWEKYLLRLMTPIIKLYTGKLSSEVVKEAMEAVGGVAYMENSGFPNLLRDTEVYSIWEGTTNVLTLDMVRVLSSAQDPDLALFKQALFKVASSRELDTRIAVAAGVIKTGKNLRKAAFELGHIFIAGLFRMAANSTGLAVDWDLCEYWKGNFEEKFFGYSQQTADVLADCLVDGKPTGVGDFEAGQVPRYKL